MKNKATHEGHCQACNAKQKLPNGKLALHGYTVEYGWFNGVCKGSKALPIEQDTTITKAQILWAKNHANTLAHVVETYRTHANEKPLFHRYHAAEGKRKSGYRWEPVTFELRDGRMYLVFEDGKSEPCLRYSMYGTEQEMRNKLDEDYAQNVEREIKDVLQYAKGRAEAIKYYFGKPLTPVVESAPIVDGVVLKNVETGEYIDTFQRAKGRYLMRPSVTFTTDRAKAKIFTKRGASLAQRPLYIFKMKCTTEAA